MKPRRLDTERFDRLVADRSQTAADIARQTGMSKGHVADLRSGRRHVTPAVAASLADALGVTTDDILRVAS